MRLAFPFRFDARGRTATVDEEAHLQGLIEQLLFTNPGERVNRPDFGSGLLQLVFAPNSPELAATVQFTTQAALQQWLGHLIEVEGLDVESEEATLKVTVRYALRRTGERRAAALARGFDAVSRGS